MIPGIPLSWANPPERPRLDRNGLEQDIEKAEHDLGISERKRIDGDWFDHPDARIPIRDEDFEE